MPVTAVRDEGALRMWVCRLPVHIGPAVYSDFTETCSEYATFSGPTESSAPTTKWVTAYEFAASSHANAAFSAGRSRAPPLPRSCVFWGAPKLTTFESPQALRASVPTLFGSPVPLRPFPAAAYRRRRSGRRRRSPVPRRTRPAGGKDR